MELLQIATAQFITKCDGLLLQIATPFLLQSATWFITNCDKYYKVRWIYYKLRQVLQSAMIITNCDSTPPLLIIIAQSLNASTLRLRSPGLPLLLQRACSHSELDSSFKKQAVLDVHVGQKKTDQCGIAPIILMTAGQSVIDSFLREYVKVIEWI